MACSLKIKGIDKIFTSNEELLEYIKNHKEQINDLIKIQKEDNLYEQSSDVLGKTNISKMKQQIDLYETDKKQLQILDKSLILAESLRRLGDFLDIRNGIKVGDFDFTKKIDNFQLYLGMPIEDYQKDKQWTLENHLEYYKKNSDDFDFEKCADCSTEELLEKEKRIADAIHIKDVMKQFKHYDSYIKEYGNQDEFRKKEFLLFNKEFDNWSKDFLNKYRTRKTWDYRNIKALFEQFKSKFIIDQYLKENHRYERYNLSIPIENIKGEWNKSIDSYNSLDISNGQDREMFKKQFPKYIDFFMSTLTQNDSVFSSVMSDLEINNANKINLINNKFLNRLEIYGKEGSERVQLKESNGIGQKQLNEIKEDFKKLPLNIQKLFQLYSLIQWGFDVKEGTLSGVVGIDLYYGPNSLTSTLDNMKIGFENNPNKYKEIGEKFVDYVSGHKEMLKYVSKEEIEKGPIIGNRPKRTVIKKKLRKGVNIDIVGEYNVDAELKHLADNKTYKAKDIYVDEVYVANESFDSNMQQTSNIQTIKIFTSEDLDILQRSQLNGERVFIQKNIISGHGYVENLNYLTPTGLTVMALVKSKTTVWFYKSGAMNVSEDKKSVGLQKLKELEGQRLTSKSIESIIGVLQSKVNGLNITIETNETASLINSKLHGVGAWVGNDGIHFNSDAIRSSHPMHELGHIIVEAVIKSNNDLYQRLSNEAQKFIDEGNILVKQINDANIRHGKYLTQESLKEEVICTIGGFSSVNVIEQYLNKINSLNDNKQEAKSIWNRIKSYVVELINKFRGIFNLKKNAKLENDKISQYDGMFISDFFKDLTSHLFLDNKLISDNEYVNMALSSLKENKTYLNNLDREAEIINKIKTTINKSKSTEIKQGVLELFKSNPELEQIGSQELYSAYLDTIFPDSKVKDILYHGTTEFEGETFRKDKLASQTGEGTASVGFHFSDKKTATVFGISSRLKTKKDIFIIPVLLNMNSPKFMEDITELRGSIDKGLIEPSNKARELIKQGFDSISIKEYQGGIDNIVFEPEQIHILGSKQDIEGFEKFIEQNKNIIDNQLVFDSKYNNEILTLLKPIQDEMYPVVIRVDTINDNQSQIRIYDNSIKLSASFGKDISSLKDLHNILNNNTGDNKNLSNANDNTLCEYILYHLKTNPINEKLQSYNYRVSAEQRFSYLYSDFNTKDESELNILLLQKIKEDILPLYTKSENNLKPNLKEFILESKKTGNIYESANKVFGQEKYNDNVIETMSSLFGINSKIVSSGLYSELSNEKNENLNKLFGNEFIGYDPFVIIHNISNDGEVTLSIYDATTRPLGRNITQLKGNSILSTMQNDLMYRSQVGEGNMMFNNDSDIRRLLLGMTIMNMQKNGKIKIKNAGVLEIHGGNIQKNMIADMNILLKNISYLSKQQIITDALNNKIKDVITDANLYKTNYQQSYLELVKLMLIEQKNDEDINNYGQSTRAKEDYLLLNSETVTKQDILDILLKRKKILENKFGKNVSGLYNDAEYQMLSKAFVEVETKNIGWVNNIKDMSSLSKNLTTSMDINSYIVQWARDHYIADKMRTVNELNDYQNRMKSLTKEIIFKSPIMKSASYLGDVGSIYFEKIFKTININGENIKLPKIYWDINDKETQRAISDNLVSKEQVEYGNKIADEFEHYYIELVYHLKMNELSNTVSTNRNSYTKQDAKKDLYERYHYEKGDVPVMKKSVNELIMKGKNKDALSLFGQQLANYEALFDQGIEEQRLDMVSASLGNQLKPEQRLEAMGLYLQDGKINVSNKELNVTASTNLERIANYTILGIVRKINYESNTIPAYNSAMAILTMLESMGHKQEQNKEFLRIYLERNIANKTQDEQNLIPIMLPGMKNEIVVDVNTLAGGLQRATTWLGVAFSPMTAVKSQVFNTMALLTNSIASSVSNIGIDNENKLLPDANDIRKALSILDFTSTVNKDFKKARAICLKYQLINRTERDILTSPFINETNKNIWDSQFSGIGNWATDVGARMIAATAVMVKDGSWNAFEYNEQTGEISYDIKKDKRFSDENGNLKTEQGANVVIEEIRQRLIKDGLQNSDDKEIKYGYSLDMANNTMKWYADKFILGAIDNDTKVLLGTTWQGRLLSQFRVFSFSRMFNAGLFAQTRLSTKGSTIKAVKDENGNWIAKDELIEIEGMWQSFGAAYKAILNLRNEDINEWWKNQSQLRRMNIVKLGMQIATFALLYALVKGFKDDDDKDKRKFTWLYKDVFIASTMAETINNPLPWLNIVMQMVKNVSKGEFEKVLPLTRQMKDVGIIDNEEEKN